MTIELFQLDLIVLAKLYIHILIIHVQDYDVFFRITFRTASKISTNNLSQSCNGILKPLNMILKLYETVYGGNTEEELKTGFCFAALVFKNLCVAVVASSLHALLFIRKVFF